MQWWSNPSARSHLEAWVNIWVRSAGLALVLAGWLLVRAKREGDVFGIAVFRPSFFLFAVSSSSCARTKVSCNKCKVCSADAMIRNTVSFDCVGKHAPDHFCNYFVDIKSVISDYSLLILFS